MYARPSPPGVRARVGAYAEAQGRELIVWCLPRRAELSVGVGIPR